MGLIRPWMSRQTGSREQGWAADLHPSVGQMRLFSFFVLVSVHVLDALTLWSACNFPFSCDTERIPVVVPQPQEFGKVVGPLFKQIARCLNSSHFQVRVPVTGFGVC